MVLLEQLQHFPETIEFSEVIAYIDQHYDFTPTAFKNGSTANEAGQNNGSCKVFSFAKLQGLTKGQTLSLFGEFYREDVLKNPNGNDHQNIRNFMEFGWEGVSFEAEALKEK
ncbi:HopJ type III effector protein [Chryseobacterium sp. SIMBA_028]|uniref:HopJ type III effector protein n=1 Tax=Chryseobacterium sp. SIMBA_028 TaxID=3085771 RepID=UPI00397D8F80